MLDGVGEERARELQALFGHLAARETFPACGRHGVQALGYLPGLRVD